MVAKYAVSLCKSNKALLSLEYHHFTQLYCLHALNEFTNSGAD
ncbi:hypothetical protein PMAN_a0797 [Pseudoalteromonas marina]|nr:hypothetical protein PMAN_a0797 [Pseudoalteromonas marina]GAA77033.1 hypothetical protein P20480_3525 [Pseudoalteromonas sp. BSi20480]